MCGLQNGKAEPRKFETVRLNCPPPPLNPLLTPIAPCEAANEGIAVVAPMENLELNCLRVVGKKWFIRPNDGKEWRRPAFRLPFATLAWARVGASNFEKLCVSAKPA